MRHRLPFGPALVVVSLGLLVSGCGDDETRSQEEIATSSAVSTGSGSSASNGAGSSGSAAGGGGSGGGAGGGSCDIDLTSANELNALLDGAMDFAVGLTCGTFPTLLVHSTGEWTSPGAGDHTEIAAVYHGTIQLDQTKVDELTEPETGALACGFDNYGRVACDDAARDWQPGTYHVLLTNYLGVMPQALGEERTYQYGFVFDQDANPANNYVPSTTYPEDFFRGTDRWYDVNKAPGQDWALQVTDATDNELADYPSGARALIHGTAIILLIPTPEIADDSPDFRTTAFAHFGDYGFDPPHVFSGDIEPPLDLPLRPW